MPTFTSAQLSAIDGAIAQGVLTVSYDGRTVTYRSLEEMRSIRAQIYRALQDDAGLRTTRQISVYATKDN